MYDTVQPDGARRLGECQSIKHFEHEKRADGDNMRSCSILRERNGVNSLVGYLVKYEIQKGIQIAVVRLNSKCPSVI